MHNIGQLQNDSIMTTPPPIHSDTDSQPADTSKVSLLDGPSSVLDAVLPKARPTSQLFKVLETQHLLRV